MKRGIRARRPLQRLRSRFLYRAGKGLCLWLAVSLGQPLAVSAGSTAENTEHVQPQSSAILSAAEFSGPTTRYRHGVLGDAVEWSGLVLVVERAQGGSDEIRFELPQDHVFEDLQPRLVDLDLDGQADAAMVVETDMSRGAALALYGAAGKIAETPHIGRSNRWLAPIGAADLDGDGRVELAYIDRPHLAKTLRIWRFEAGNLSELSSKQGLTNHRIGEDFITSGLRRCNGKSELVTVDSGWRKIVATSLVAGKLTSREIGDFSGAQSLQNALNCP